MLDRRCRSAEVRGRRWRCTRVCCRPASRLTCSTSCSSTLKVKRGACGTWRHSALRCDGVDRRGRAARDPGEREQLISGRSGNGGKFAFTAGLPGMAAQDRVKRSVEASHRDDFAFEDLAAVRVAVDAAAVAKADDVAGCADRERDGQRGVGALAGERWRAAVGVLSLPGLALKIRTGPMPGLSPRRRVRHRTRRHQVRPLEASPRADLRPRALPEQRRASTRAASTPISRTAPPFIVPGYGSPHATRVAAT